MYTAGRRHLESQMSRTTTATATAPIPASTYRLDYFSTFDSQQKATWDAYRSDLKSGRVWHFICCQTTSWSEIVNAK